MESQQPMRIVRIEMNKKRAYYVDVLFENGDTWTVHEDLVVRHRLVAGVVVTPEAQRQAAADARVQEALEQALSFLASRARSEQEVRRKLKDKGHEADVISEVLDKLRAREYVNDREFAARWGEARLRSKQKGRRWIRQELVQKGVGAEHVQHALDQLDPGEEQRIADELARKKWRQTKGDARARAAKTAAFLLRRGYPNAVVYEAVRRAKAAEPADAGDDDGFEEEPFDPIVD